MNSIDISTILKERLRVELSGTVTNALNKVMKSSADDLNEIEIEEEEILRAAVAEVTQTERYWKTRNNIILDSRRLHLEPTPVRSSYSYLPNDQIEELGELLYHPDLELRLKSLDYLLRCVSNETLLLLPGWKRLENGLRLNSLHDVAVLSEVSLQVYKKFLNSSDSRLVKEIYRSLLKALGVRLSPNSKPDSNPRVRIITVLVNFLQNLPRKWVRFPEAAIEGIVSSTVYALDSCKWSNDEEEFGLAHSFGVVDPHSDWLKNLLLSAPVRLKLFNYLKSTSFVNQVTEIVKMSFDKTESMTSRGVTNIISSYDGVEDIMTSFEKIDNLTSHGIDDLTSNKVDFNTSSYEGLDDTSTREKRADNMTSREKQADNLTSHEKSENHCLTIRDKIEVSYDLISSISVLCKLIEVKDGYELIGDNNEAWVVWDKIVSIVSRLNKPDNHFFSIESILERNPRFAPHILRPFLTTPVNTKFSLTVINKALGKLELSPELSLSINNYLIKLATRESDCHLLILIYQRLIQEFPPEVEINQFYQMIPRDFRVYRFLSKLSRNQITIQIDEIRNVCDQSTFLEYLREGMKSFEHNREHCEHCEISFIRDTLGLAEVLSCVKETVAIVSKSIWKKTSCFCDDQNDRVLKYLTSIYVSFVPYYPKIDLNDESEFYQLPLLLPPDDFCFECVECYQIISLTIYRLLFNSLDNVIYFESKFNIRSRLFESLDEPSILDQISILKNDILVQTGLLGGPSERITPAYNLDNDCSFKLLDNLNYPREYATKLSVEIPYEFTLTMVDKNTLLSEFLNYLSHKNGNFVIIRQFWDCFLDIEYNIELGEIDVHTNNESTSARDVLVKMFLFYALSHNWLKETMEVHYYEDILTNLPQTNQYLFLTCFLIANGDILKTNQIFNYFVNVKYFLDIPSSKELDQIVKIEIPRVYHSLTMSSLKPRDVVSHWTNQLFLNVLDMSDVVSIMLICVLKSNRQILYWSIALLKLYETRICSEPRIDLNIYFAESRPCKLNMKDYFEFVLELEKKYEKILT